VSPPEVDLDEVRRRWVGVPFEEGEHPIALDDLLTWARACGETDGRFVDPDHPDFQAHPTYTARFSARPFLPDEFPEVGSGGIDGGKRIEATAPIRPGDVLSSSTSIAEIYEKTGRSGTMVFVVHRMAFANQRGEAVSTVDSKMIRSGVRA
jgi:acyl dehydratase